MADTDRQKKLLQEYKKKSDILLNKMYSILYRMQRKADDEKYRKILEELEK